VSRRRRWKSEEKEDERLGWGKGKVLSSSSGRTIRVKKGIELGFEFEEGVEGYVKL